MAKAKDKSTRKQMFSKKTNPVIKRKGWKERLYFHWLISDEFTGPELRCQRLWYIFFLLYPWLPTIMISLLWWQWHCTERNLRAKTWLILCQLTNYFIGLFCWHYTGCCAMAYKKRCNFRHWSCDIRRKNYYTGSSLCTMLIDDGADELPTF